MDLEKSDNIINTNNVNDLNINSNDDINNQIVKTCKGEIIQNDLENDEINKFKSSQEYSEMISLYKSKLYPDYLTNNEKSESDENDNNNNSKSNETD